MSFTMVNCGLEVVEDQPSLMLMQETSRDLKNKLAGMSGPHTAILMFGSPHRAEMLPKSDVDLIVVTDRAPEGIEERQDIIDKTKSLSYDKVDIPANITTLEDIFSIYTVGSPESNMADCTLIAGGEDVKTSWRARDMSTFFSSPGYLVPKQVFQHFFFDSWSRKKQSMRGVNIKYSIGGARDLLILDQFHDLRTAGAGKTEANVNNTPQIVSYMLDRFFDRRLQFQRVARSIGLIVMVKHATLNIEYGALRNDRGILNGSTAEAMVTQIPELHDYAASGEDLTRKFNAARSLVRLLREEEYRAMIDRNVRAQDPKLADLHDRIYSSTDMSESDQPLVREVLAADHDITDIVYLARSSGAGPASLPEALISRIMGRASWFSVGTLAMHESLSGHSLDELAVNFSKKPGFEFLNRLLIRHPSLTKTTAERLMANDRLAVDDDVDMRYRKELSERYAKLTV